MTQWLKVYVAKIVCNKMTLKWGCVREYKVYSSPEDNEKGFKQGN